MNERILIQLQLQPYSMSAGDAIFNNWIWVVFRKIMPVNTQYFKAGFLVEGQLVNTGISGGYL